MIANPQMNTEGQKTRKIALCGLTEGVFKVESVKISVISVTALDNGTTIIAGCVGWRNGNEYFVNY